MPYLKKSTAVKIPLASDKHYFVMWRDKVNYGSLRHARQNAVKIVVKEGATEPTPEFDAMAYSDHALLAHIESWNLDDEKGEPLPLTIESIGLLDSDDVALLNERMATSQEKQEKERKNS